MLQSIAQKLLEPINASAIVILGAMTFCWGLWVASPFWHTFGQAAVFNTLNEFFGEAFWGFAALCVGLAIIYGVVKPSYHSLRRGAFVGWLFWSVIAVLYLQGDWKNTAWVVSIWLATYCAFVWLNITVNKHYPPG